MGSGCHLLFAAFIALLAPVVAAAQNTPDLSGNWVRTRTGGGSFGPDELTEAGRRVWEDYDFRKDDPAYRCIASSWARVWGNTDVVIEISQARDDVRLRYEWMDIDRRVPLVDPAQPNPKRTNIRGMPSLGSSTAWYDGDALVIETVDYGPGYVDTVNVTADGTRRAGLPQSRMMRTIERIRRSGDTLTVEITHVDPAYYTKPFVVTRSYARTDAGLLKYGCTPEDASIVAPR